METYVAKPPHLPFPYCSGKAKKSPAGPDRTRRGVVDLAMDLFETIDIE